MAHRDGVVRADDEATRALVARARTVSREYDQAGAAARLVRLAGGRVYEDHAEFGLWVPELSGEGGDAVERVEIEFLTLTDEVRLDEAGGSGLRRQRLPMEVDGEWGWLAVGGATLGARDVVGTLYRFVLVRPDGSEITRNDPLAASLPFGVRAPAELYDVGRMHTARADADFFRRVGIGGDDGEGEPPRVTPPAHILELHVGTATHGGTIADLADLFRALADKVRNGEEPTPAESAFLGYDAVQLMPLEPQVGDPAATPAFESSGGDGEEVATLRPPRTLGWGYDVALLGSAAIEPSLLRSGRPDELVDLAAVLHSFPGKPIRLVFDLVFGHANAAARELLPPAFFRGEGEYGPRPDLAHPIVRAMLKEMQRRKVDYGADGIRVDASHDLILREGEDADAGDDSYLTEMSEVVQRVADVRYRPFVIFEDGRPDAGGRRAAPPSYTDVLRDRPEAFAWGPLTFADAEPFLEGFWGSVGWRLDEIARHGGQWVQGYANHDTLRRAYLRRPDVSVNRRLGGSLPEISRRAYDHPAADLAIYGLLPGLPMSFLPATLRAPWAFFRDAPSATLPRTAAGEVDVLTWSFAREDYAADDAFVRLKGLGLDDLESAVALFEGLREVVRSGESDARTIAAAAEAAGLGLPGPGGAEGLLLVSRSFMRDLRDACLVWRWEHRLDPERSRTSRDLRRIRRERAWLSHDLREKDRFERRVRGDGGVFVWGLRHAPDGSESVALLANLEGEPWTVVPEEILGGGPWELLLRAPAGPWEGAGHPLTLHDAEGLLLRSEG